MSPVTPPTPEPAAVTAPTLELAHVLFIDIVDYSKLALEEQHTVLCQLQEAVRDNPPVARGQAEGKVICLRTEHGMALVFFGSPECPVHCALELSRSLHQHPKIKLRMGIHTGPVYRFADINENLNVEGGGINTAQRVMDCGDAGHILVSNAVADVLSQLSSWSHFLHDLGEAEVKHGLRVHIYNLCTDEVGNAELPQKLKAAQRTEAAKRSRSKRKKLSLAMVAGFVVTAIAAGSFSYSRRHSEKLTVKDTVVVADFANKTGDTVFDDTLKTALRVSLNQSPFLNVLSPSTVAATLQLMARPAGTKLTPEVARELCLRARSKAYIAGSIVRLGNEYVLWLKAVNCQSGDTLAQEQITAAAQEKVVDALGQAASVLRGELGESLNSVQKYSAPLQEATTSSLEALQEFTWGQKVADAESLAHFKRALELDPNFALAYADLGVSYKNLGQTGLANQNFMKAYDLRYRASQRERFYIEWLYYNYATGELIQGTQSCFELAEAYPADAGAHAALAVNYGILGQYDKAIEELQQELRLNPDDVIAYSNLMGFYAFLNRFDDDRTAFDQARARKLDDPQLRQNRYMLAFLQRDIDAMQEQLAWATGKAGIEDVFFSLQSDTEAYYGRMAKARSFSRQALDSARRANTLETAAGWRANEALREAEAGNPSRARKIAAEALGISTGKDVNAVAALTLARAGDVVQAQKLANQLDHEYTLDTIVQNYTLPVIRAAIEVQKNNPEKAVNILRVAAPYELGAMNTNLGSIYPAYIRGHAYLRLKQGKQAAAEFQKLIDHHGVVQNFVTGSLAYLQLGRSQAMMGDKEAARKSYQNFLTMWKHADLDIPTLKQAKAEYTKLQ